MPPSLDVLKSSPYFAVLNAKAWERIRKEVVALSFSQGEILFLEGEPCRGLYVVKSGRIRVFRTSPEGREQVLLIAKQGDSFNDLPLFDGGPNPASASALEAAGAIRMEGHRICVIDAGKLKKMA
jgi:CRP/FNR family transcriptional regulator